MSMLFKFIFIPVLLLVIAAANQCRLRPFHLQDHIYGSCPDFADLSPKNESNYAIAAGPFPCGTCIQLTYQNRLQRVIIVDSVTSPGIDLHLEPLSKLANFPDPSVLVQGLVGCEAQVVPLEMCNPNLPSSETIPSSGLAAIREQIGDTVQQPLKQPWMNLQPESGPLPNQSPFVQDQSMPSPNFNKNGIFEFNGNLHQPQQPNLMQQQPNFMQQPFQAYQQNSYLQQQHQQQQQQQALWRSYVQNNQAQIQRGQMPQNPPMFLRRKTQIRVYD